MIKAIVFDCFGVIITDALQLVREDLRRYNPEGATEIDDLVRAVNRGLIEPGESRDRISAILGVTTDEYRQKISEGEVKDLALLEYALELRAKYKTAMLSNIPGGSLRRRFSEEELDKYFDVVVASGDIGFAKPEARAYEIVAERLELRCDECVFIDDRELFVEGAREVGMKGIVYSDLGSLKESLASLLV